MTLKYKIALFTTSDSAANIIEICQIKNLSEVVVIIYPRNRKNTEKIKSVIRMAEKLNIPCIEQPYTEGLEEFERTLVNKGVNLGISWNYSQIIKVSTLRIFELGIWNMHGGKIPEYRGANVLQWAIANGEREIGVTWHVMEEEVDSGDILIKDTVPVEETETALEVRDKIFSKGIQLFKILWHNFINGQITKESPDLTKGKVYPPRRMIHGLIDTSFSKKQVKDILRAQCPPWPRPYIIYNGEIRPVHGIEECKDYTEIVSFPCKDGLINLYLGPEVNDKELKKLLLEKQNR
ncbi:methionyl-tRNA formyltransferase [Desulforamulus ferrireducens]|uniref:Formyl transferase N-terminal domain-containing protein n=1 Tax=Desulforamulus ferrireducens TaxID=1833852 RepID=A0A1S6J013_9FIRM|nr:formyltransferase family protein [Desulforamulus ferrireducens]AQS60354.1 hypothetical protein B0537_15545 [Desulforamulus ferrireducens]